MAEDDDEGDDLFGDDSGSDEDDAEAIQAAQARKVASSPEHR